MKRFLVKVLVTTGGVAAGEWVRAQALPKLPATLQGYRATGWALTAVGVVGVQKIANKFMKS